MVQKPSSPPNALLQNSDRDGSQESWAAITPQVERWNLQISVCVQPPGGKHCWAVAWVMKKATSVWFSLNVQQIFRTQKLEQRKAARLAVHWEFPSSGSCPSQRFLNQHAKDAAKLRISLWRAIIFLVYSSIHCLRMFVLAVFGFRTFSNLHQVKWT